MAMNRVQFQRGLSMAEFIDRYGTDAQCEAALVASRWPDGFACPVCGAPASCSFRRQGRLYWQCAACRRQCSVIGGRIFESTKLPLTRWFLAIHLLAQAKNNVSALELKRHFTKESVEQFAAQSLARPLTVVSDGLWCFTAAEGAGVHERVVIGGGKAGVKPLQFQAVNTVLSNLKTAMAGTYHAVKFAKYAQRYLAELQFRFNRRFDPRSILRGGWCASPRPPSPETGASFVRLRLVANQVPACPAQNASASIPAPQTSSATLVASPSQCPAGAVFSHSTNSARPAIQ